MFHRNFYFRAHGCLYLKRIGYGFIVNGTDSFVRQECGTFFLVLLVIGVIHNSTKICSCFNLRYHGSYSLLE